MGLRRGGLSVARWFVVVAMGTAGCGENEVDETAKQPEAGGDGAPGDATAGSSAPNDATADGSANAGPDAPADVSLGQDATAGDAAGVPVTGPRASRDGTVSLDACTAQGAASLSGRVFDPAGRNPIPNVTVWVPFTTPGPIPSGAGCDCGSWYTGGYVGAYALTDATGAFVLSPAPASTTGGDVPLVLQIGKWRTQTTFHVVCGQDNPVPDGALRLPSRQATTAPAATDPAGALTGDLPSIAISTGGADFLECLLTRIGLSESEYTPGVAAGNRVHVFQGSPSTAPTMPGAPSSSVALWDTTADLARFDAVLLSCEGAPTTNPNVEALFEYVDAGGRVLATHYHYQWLISAPWPDLGTWFTTNPNALTNPSYGIPTTTLPNGASFPEAAQMKTWLGGVGALNGAGELAITLARHNVDVQVGNVGIPWMFFDPQLSTFPPTVPFDPVGPQSALLASYDPLGPMAGESCGRVVYSDIHVGYAGDYGEVPNSYAPAGPFDVPAGCIAGGDLSVQEKALEYMLFSVTSCLVPPGATPGFALPLAP